MGRVGSASDNAMAESFFATPKAELVYRRAWPTRHELELEAFSYTEGFDNPRRRHSRLDNLSPVDSEKNLTQQMT
jgi:putative transposase